LTTSFTYNRILIYDRTWVKPDGNVAASVTSSVLLIETRYSCEFRCVRCCAV